MITFYARRFQDLAARMNEGHDALKEIAEGRADYPLSAAELSAAAQVMSTARAMLQLVTADADIERTLDALNFEYDHAVPDSSDAGGDIDSPEYVYDRTGVHPEGLDADGNMIFETLITPKSELLAQQGARNVGLSESDPNDFKGMPRISRAKS